MEIGKLIQEISYKEGLTYNDIAKKSGTDKRLLLKYINGDTAPNVNTAIKILNSLGYRLYVVKEDELLGLGGE